jgi:hypothetical protein
MIPALHFIHFGLTPAQLSNPMVFKGTLNGSFTVLWCVCVCVHVNMMGSDHLKDQCADAMILLKWILKEENERVADGSI